MIRIMLLGLLLALVTLTPDARGEEKETISFEARAGWTVLGGERTTGGLTLGGAVRYLGPLGSLADGEWGIYGGGSVAAVGVGDTWHWMGVLSSPETGAWWASGPWHVSAGLALPMGQLPTCTDWGLCLRSWGIFGEGSARVALRSESVRIGLEASAMWVETLPWAGLGGQLRIVGAYR